MATRPNSVKFVAASNAPRAGLSSELISPSYPRFARRPYRLEMPADLRHHDPKKGRLGRLRSYPASKMLGLTEQARRRYRLREETKRDKQMPIPHRLG